MNFLKNSYKTLLFACVIAFTSTSWADLGLITLSHDVRNNPQVEAFITQDKGKVQVIEFFSYGCSACARFEPKFEQWMASMSNKNVVIHKIPVTFNQREWRSLANLYYIAKDIDPTGKLDEKIFQALHTNSQRLWEESAMQKFFMDNGFTEQQFKTAYSKYSNNNMAETAQRLSDIYGINKTPTIVVNGATQSYMVTASQSDPNFFKIVDEAIDKAS